MLQTLLKSLEHPKDRVVIVTTVAEPVAPADVDGLANHVLMVMQPHHYISRWWNRGLNWIHEHTTRNYEVLAISSDHTGTNYSVAALATTLRRNNMAMVGPNYWSDREVIFTKNTVPGVHNRVPGGCWMVAGELGLRVDENFRWWYSDDDLDMQARQIKYTGLVPHTGLIPGPDSGLSEEKQQWALEDREKFVAKWNRQPW